MERKNREEGKKWNPRKACDATYNGSPPAYNGTTHPIPQQWSASKSPTPPVYALPLAFSVWNISCTSPGHLSWLCPASSSCTSLPAEYGKLKSPWFRIRTTQQQPKHHCAFNAVLILNPKCSTVPATWKKMNSVPAKTRTVSCMSHWTVKWEKKLARYMERYCKICFAFLPSREYETRMQHHNAILFSPSISFSLMSLGKKKRRVEQAFVFPICWLARGTLRQMCVTNAMYVVDNHKDEGRIVVRMRVLQWNYIVIWVKLVILLNWFSSARRICLC